LILLAEGDCAPLGAFVASLESCGSIHLGNDIGLTGKEQNRNMGDGRPRAPRLLSLCDCQDRLQGLHAQWGLRLAAKFGPEIGQGDLLDRFSYDCRGARRRIASGGVSACGVYLPDLEQPRPQDMPPGLVRLRVVVSND
jgi:hypothetical protein